MADQAFQGSKLPRPAVMGIASGIFFMAFFGAYWGFLSTTFMSSTFQIIAFILIGLVTAGFLGIAGMLLRYARSLPKILSPEEAVVGKRISMWFGIIFVVEFLLIGLANALLSTFQANHFFAPVTALIVGIHFFPLAHLFHVSAYYVTGALLSVLALIALVALLLGLSIAGPSPYNWSQFVGVGATLILWLTALFITRFGLRAMRQRA